MGITLPTAVRNTAADSVVDRVDAGAGAGTLSGTMPALLGTLAQTIAVSTPQVTATIRVRSLSATVTPG